MDLPGLEASSVLFSSSSGISGCQLPQMQWEGAWEGQVPIVGAALLEAGGRHCGSCFRIGVPAHLPDTRQLSRTTPARSSA